MNKKKKQKGAENNDYKTADDGSAGGAAYAAYMYLRTGTGRSGI